MRERLINFALALLALFVVLVLFLPPASRGGKTSKPNTEDRRESGYSALVALLDRQGRPWHSFRERLTELSSRFGEGHVLLASDDTFYLTSNAEDRAVARWVAAGNTVILAARCDCDSCPANALLEDMGLAVGNARSVERQATDWEAASLEPPSLSRYVPQTAHPLIDGITTIAQVEPAWPQCDVALGHIWSADRDGASPEYCPVPNKDEADAADDDWSDEDDASDASDEDEYEAPLSWIDPPVIAPPYGITLLKRADSPIGAGWYAPFGAGHVVVVGAESAWRNANLARADNATWLGQILRQLAPPDAVLIFADYHQGLSSYYDPKRFFADQRTYVSAAFLAIFWLLYATARWTRLRPPAVPRARGRPTASAEGAATLFARELDFSEAAQALQTDFYLETVRQLGLPSIDAAARHWAQHPVLSAMQRSTLASPTSARSVATLQAFTAVICLGRRALQQAPQRLQQGN